MKFTTTMVVEGMEIHNFIIKPKEMENSKMAVCIESFNLTVKTPLCLPYSSSIPLEVDYNSFIKNL